MAEEEVAVAVVEDVHVHGAHLMTAGDALPQEVDPDLEVEAQDLVVVHEIVQNTDLSKSRSYTPDRANGNGRAASRSRSRSRQHLRSRSRSRS